MSNQGPSKEISLSELIDGYAQSLGQEGARKTWLEAIDESGMPRQDKYSLPQVLQIIQALKKKPGFIGTLARCMENRFRADAFILQNQAQG